MAKTFIVSRRYEVEHFYKILANFYLAESEIEDAIKR